MKRLLLAALAVLIWAGVAGATVPKYWMVTTATLGSDSSDAAPDSVFLFWLDQASATLDSAAMTPLNTDSLAWVYLLDANLEGWVKTYNPVTFAKWYFGSAIIRDNALGTIPWSTGHLDSLDQVIAATATIDYDTLAAIVDDSLTAAHGAGAWTSGGAGSGAYAIRIVVVDTVTDTEINGADVWVWNAANTVLEAHLVTAIAGYADFALDSVAGGWDFAVNESGYFQSPAFKNIVTPQSALVDTVEVYSFTPITPSGADSINLVFYLPSRNYRVRVTPLLQEEGHKDTSGILILDDPQYAEPAAVTFAAQVVVLRSSAASPAIPYDIVVYHKDTQKQLLRLPRYITPDSATAVVDW